METEKKKTFQKLLFKFASVIFIDFALDLAMNLIATNSMLENTHNSLNELILESLYS